MFSAPVYPDDWWARANGAHQRECLVPTNRFDKNKARIRAVAAKDLF
jgi:hypothetical protein